MIYRFSHFDICVCIVSCSFGRSLMRERQIWVRDDTTLLEEDSPTQSPTPWIGQTLLHMLLAKNSLFECECSEKVRIAKPRDKLEQD